MSKAKFTEAELNKLTDLERTTYDTHVSFCGMVLLLTTLGAPFVGVMFIADFIWDNKLTLFLALSSGLLELLCIILMVTSLYGFGKKVKELKERVSTR